MATSGTFTFNLDLSDAMEEAFERAGLELRSGYDYKTARRSLNLMMRRRHSALLVATYYCQGCSPIWATEELALEVKFS